VQKHKEEGTTRSLVTLKVRCDCGQSVPARLEAVAGRVVLAEKLPQKYATPVSSSEGATSNTFTAT
jgi:hypothetical protein